MERRQFVLAALSPANGGQHTPVQVQKLFFLLDREAAEMTGGPYFAFVPYDYGPFDSDVYTELRELSYEGKVEGVNNGHWTSYRLTALGQQEADMALAQLSPDAQDYIRRVSEFIRGLSFSELVRAIYRAYPDMKVNSVFQG